MKLNNAFAILTIIFLALGVIFSFGSGIPGSGLVCFGIAFICFLICMWFTKDETDDEETSES